MLIRLFFAALGCLFLANSAWGSPVTINFTGSATSVDGVFATQAGVTAVTGTLTYDSAMLDSLPGRDDVDRFETTNNPGSVFELSVTFGVVTGSFSAPAADGSFSQFPGRSSDFVEIGMGQRVGGDGFVRLFTFNPIVPPLPPRLFPSGVTPGTPIDLTSIVLADNPFRGILRLGASSDNSLSFDITSFSSISNVPIPAAAWLFISGLAGLFGFKRYKAA